MPTKTGGPAAPQQQPATERRPEPHNLTVQYGKIGIPAVAAALRYTGVAKNPAYAPVESRVDLRLIEMAA